MNKMQKPEVLTFTPLNGIKNYPVYANGEKLRSGQLDLAIFYRNCAEGYRLRALALYVN